MFKSFSQPNEGASPTGLPDRIFQAGDLRRVALLHHQEGRQGGLRLAARAFLRGLWLPQVRRGVELRMVEMRGVEIMHFAKQGLRGNDAHSFGHGQNPIVDFSLPVNIRFNPTTQIGSKMGGEFTYPKMVTLGLTHCHLFMFSWGISC